ncbi:DUF4129 domain-containing protein [Streptomonospora nanhaiensis]|uniref:Protein-glutamine gamma-glutamyltransferase-like C-terminal domain-containing protein n=1 Tax=Streptomonospora nanhaiensis TaxID=1323731 RepID=A0A853BN94_9ACTN|nr:DUF4129 domain-containing protein [Streptomonospora nanhaiensis]MBV2362096.1 DUF4129 domain-containing protein [Streptomonospora nanhaiensis]NYI96076.1 hypothetical protein [Streptomonospora nanhaiensis]
MTGAAPVLAAAAAVDREEGARLAREELAKPPYREAEPSLLDRVLMWLQDWFANLLDAGADVPGGWWVLAPLLAVLLLLLVGLVVYLRPALRRRRPGAAVDSGAPLTAADHRAAAERHAGEGDYAAAIRERLRAISRDLEDRAVITPRPGRTATELAAETAVELPHLRERLYAAATTFNDSAYGQRTATADGYRLLRDLDDLLRAGRPAATASASADEGGAA